MTGVWERGYDTGKCATQKQGNIIKRFPNGREGGGRGTFTEPMKLADKTLRGDEGARRREGNKINLPKTHFWRDHVVDFLGLVYNLCCHKN